MFILGVDPRQDASSNIENRVAQARKQFDELLGGAHQAEQQQQPDVIVLHNAHWTLLNMATEGSPTEDMEMSGAPMLSEAFMHTYMESLARLVQLVRAAFPETVMVMHTAAMVRWVSGRGHGRVGSRFLAQSWSGGCMAQLRSGRCLVGKCTASAIYR